MFLVSKLKWVACFKVVKKKRGGEENISPLAARRRLIYIGQQKLHEI